MNPDVAGWITQALATDAPLLPTLDAMQVWLHLGWSVVLAWLAASLVRRGRWTVALLVALWAWAPGAYSPAYWLGLAFQGPSVATVLLCAGGLWEGLGLAPHSWNIAPAAWVAQRSAQVKEETAQRAGDTEQNAVPLKLLADRRILVLSVLGAVTGWALLLDTLALLPLQMYAWGFSPLAVGLISVTALLPWVWGLAGGTAPAWRLAVVPLSVLVFVVWRLPSGNVWDAVLDPLLWIALQVQLARFFWSRYKNRS